MAQWSLTTLREKFVKIGARIVRHGRYVVFQLAEVAVPRALFAEILDPMDSGCEDRPCRRPDGTSEVMAEAERRQNCAEGWRSPPKAAGRPTRRLPAVYAALHRTFGGPSVDKRPIEEQRRTQGRMPYGEFG